MFFNMREYWDDCCAVYTKITRLNLFKKAVTPFLSEGAFCKADDNVKG